MEEANESSPIPNTKKNVKNSTSLQPIGLMRGNSLTSSNGVVREVEDLTIQEQDTDNDSSFESEEFETGETYWAILIWNVPLDYTQWILVFELVAHLRVFIEY